MKLRFTISGTYEVSEEEALKAYGTTNPEEMVKIDLQNLKEDPESFVYMATDIKVHLERDLQGLAEQGYREANQ